MSKKEITFEEAMDTDKIQKEFQERLISSGMRVGKNINNLNLGLDIFKGKYSNNKKKKRETK